MPVNLERPGAAAPLLDSAFEMNELSSPVSEHQDTRMASQLDRRKICHPLQALNPTLGKALVLNPRP